MKGISKKKLVFTMVMLLMMIFPLNVYATGNTAVFSGVPLGTGLGSPIDVIFDGSGNLYVADYNGKISKMDANGQNITTIASGITGGIISMTFDNNGNLYVTEDIGHKILKIDPMGNITNVATNLSASITGIVLDGAGHLYGIEYYGDRILGSKILKMNIDGSNATDFVTGLNNYLFGLDKDSEGNLYFADSTTNSIKKVSTSAAITTFATGLSNPHWVTIGQDGYFYVSDYGSHSIKKLDTNGNIIASYGTGTNTAWGLAVNECGYIYFTNFSSNVFKIMGDAATSGTTHIIANMNTSLEGTTADPAAFTLHGIASNPTVINAVVTGSAIDLTLSSPIAYTDTSIKLDYTKTGVNNLRTNGIDLENFISLPAVNKLASVISVQAIQNIYVANGTTQGAINLPQNVNVNLSNATTTSAAITWDNNPTYDGNTQGTYGFTGTLILPDGVVNPSNRKASVSVTVAVAIVSTVQTIPNINIVYGTTQSAIGLPSNISIGLSNSTSTSAAVTWDNANPTYNPNVVGIYAFTGTLTLPQGVINPNNKQANVNVVVYAGGTNITPNMVSFDKNVLNQADISVNMVLNGTTLSSITNGTSILVNGVDFVTTGSAVTISKSYLAQQSVGTTILNFNFTNGSKEVLTIIIVNNGVLTTSVIIPVVTVIDSNSNIVVTIDSSKIDKDKINVIVVNQDNQPKPESKIQVQIPASYIGVGTGSFEIDTKEVSLNIPTSIIDSSILSIGGRLQVSLNLMPSTDSTLLLENISADAIINGKVFTLVMETYDSNNNLVSRIHDFGNGKSVGVTINLSNDDIKGMDTSRISAFYYDTTSKKWIDMGGSFDPVKITYTFTTTHFTDFTIMQKSATVIGGGSGGDDSTGVTTPVGTTLEEVKPVVTPQAATINRLSGLNRIETSIAIAKEQYTDKKPDAVVLATAEGFADALAGSGLAYKNNAPLLLVNKTIDDSQNVLDYIITNLSKDKTVYILGETGVISKEISDYLIEQGYKVVRLGGKDRYETNQKIVDSLNVVKGTSLVIATGDGFADALSISSIADIKGFPVLLNAKDNLSANVSNDIMNLQPTTVYVIGGEGVLSTNIEEQIKNLNGSINIVRLGGKDRYETSMMILDYFNLPTTTIALATGIDFPDALSGSVLAARKSSGVLLVDNKDVTKQKELLSKEKITNVIVFGGEGVIGTDIATSLIQK